MNFLIDAQLPPALCGWLRERGHNAVHVFEIGMVAASDDEIADRAEADGAVVVSKDEDSSCRACRTGSRSCGCTAATRTTVH